MQAPPFDTIISQEEHMMNKEEWFRCIDEAVRHKDWKRRLFGKKSNYRKDKRKYRDRCGDCKWKPMIPDARGMVKKSG